VVAGRARSLAFRRPDAAEDRLQPDAVLVRGEDFDDLARMPLRLFGKDGGELFLRLFSRWLLGGRLPVE